MVNVGILLIFLIFFCNQIDAWYSVAFRGLPHISSRYQSKTALSETYNLEDVITVDNFLNSKVDKVTGVFALENGVGDVIIVESSDDIQLEIKSIIDKYVDTTSISFKDVSVRIQSFSSTEKDLRDAYKTELIRNTNPLIIDYVKKAQSTILSPFATNSTKVIEFEDKYISDSDLTVENVNRVLDEVRPFLIADGGNIAVVSVDPITRNIELTLQGACGTCSSSTVLIDLR